MSDGSYVDGSWFYYAPNKGAPVFFAVAFAASAGTHLWQCLRYKCFSVTGLLPFCTAILAAGFAVRAYSAFDYDNLNTFIATTFLVYTAPPLLELANYHVLGRILHFVPHCTPIHPGRVLTTFGLLSCVIEILNALGVMYTAIRGVPQKTVDTGSALLKASLILQLAVAALFVLLAAVFQHRVRAKGIKNKKVTMPIVTLYISQALITVRTIYRVVEYWALEGTPAQAGSGGVSPVIKHEWFFYVFEAVMMLLDCVLFNVLHPRRFLPESNKIYLAVDGVSEVYGPGWSEDRPFIMTLCDPFNFMGALQPTKTGKDGRKFWETDGIGGSAESQ